MKRPTLIRGKTTYVNTYQENKENPNQKISSCCILCFVRPHIAAFGLQVQLLWAFKSTCIRSYIFWQYKRFFEIFWSFFSNTRKQEGFFQKFRDVAEVAIIHK